MPRPPVATVFGILNIVFGAMSLLCSPLSLIMTMVPMQTNNPASEIIHESMPLQFWLYAATVIGMVGGAVLLAAGIGLLKMQPWARITSVVYAIFAIVFGVVGQVVNWFLLIMPLMEQAKNQNGPAAAAGIGGAIGGMAGGCFGLVFPILLLIFMTRPKVVAALRNQSPVA